MARPSYIRFRDGKPGGASRKGRRHHGTARRAASRARTMGDGPIRGRVRRLPYRLRWRPHAGTTPCRRKATGVPHARTARDGRQDQAIPYETIRGWTAGQVFGRVIVINGRDATQERLKALGDQLRTGARGYRVVNVDVYDDLEAAHNRDSMAGKANSNDVSDDECRALLSYDIAHRVANYTRGNNVDELTIHLNGTTATVDYSTPEEKATRDAWRRDHPPPLLLEPRVPSARRLSPQLRQTKKAGNGS